MQTEVAHPALAHIGRLYRVEHDAKELIGTNGLKSEQAWLAWHRQRWALRQENSCPLPMEFWRWPEATEQTVLPKSAMGQALQCVLPRWDGLVRYCENGAAEAVQLLLDKCADSTVLNHNCETPHDVAMARQHNDIADMLYYAAQRRDRDRAVAEQSRDAGASLVGR